MKNSVKKVDDRSRNGSNAEKSPERAIVTFYKAVEEIADVFESTMTLHREILEQLKKVFTDDQIACIIAYSMNSKTRLKEEFFEYIDHEGKTLYNIGNPETLKSTIGLLNEIEFDVFIRLMISLRFMDRKMLIMRDFLKIAGRCSDESSIK